MNQTSQPTAAKASFRKLLLTIAMMAVSLTGLALEVTRMTVEMTETPLALDTDTPRFGWRLDGSN